METTYRYKPTRGYTRSKLATDSLHPIKNRSRSLIFFFVVLNLLIFGCQHIPRPKSDVPVITSIGNWSYKLQNSVQIDDLHVEAVDPQLWAFNNRTLVRFRIKGRLHWKYQQAFIQSVHISERLVQKDWLKKKDISKNSQLNDVYYAIIELTPIVSIRKGKSPKTKPVPFDIKVERIFQTFGFGPNEYFIRCLDKEVPFRLRQGK